MVELTWVNFKNRKTIFYVLTIVAVLILISFGLITILGSQSPPTTQTVAMDPINWELERATFGFGIHEDIGAFYEIDGVQINQSVRVGHFDHQDSDYGGSSVLGLIFEARSEASFGHVERIKLTFLENYTDSQVWISPITELLQAENLSILNFEHRLPIPGNSTKASVELVNPEKAKSTYLWSPFDWALRSPENRTHQLQIDSETTYYNGTAFKKVLQTFRFELIVHNNTSFENAQELVQGQTCDREVLGGNNWNDYYRIFLNKNDTVQITMKPPIHSDYDLFLYNPSDLDNPAANSTRVTGLTDSISYLADMDGWWFIEVRFDGGGGLYTLIVQV